MCVCSREKASDDVAWFRDERVLALTDTAKRKGVALSVGELVVLSGRGSRKGGLLEKERRPGPRP